MNYDSNNIFAKILREEVPCKKVFENMFFTILNPQKQRLPDGFEWTVTDVHDMKTIKEIYTLLNENYV